jgi:hypothetical protein
MALVTTQTPNFIGGVSQQPAALRLPNQAEVQENAIGTVIEGLKKRPNSDHQGTLAGAPTSDSMWHIINRDATEQYAIALSDEDVRVYNLGTGASVPIYDIGGDVATAADFGYMDLASAESANDIEAITLADYTIVLNKSIQPKMSSATTTARNPEALIFVKAGNYGTSYVITYKKGSDTGTVTYLTQDGADADDIFDIKTDHIAEALHHGMTASSLNTNNYPGISRSGTWPLPAGWATDIEGSSIWLQRDDTTDFTIRSDDSVASTNLVVLKGSVQSFSNLPTVAPNGFKLKLDGLPDKSSIGSQAYYVEFETTSETTTGAPTVAAFEDGIWKESVAAGIEYKIDATTMPHLLIRMSNGNFLWTKADGVATSGGLPALTPPKWGEREVGDDISNPRSAWLAKSDGTDGEPIRNMAFFADRLVLLSGEDITLSESGRYFDFFRTTVTTLLDSARIGVTAAHTSVNLLNYAVALREQLVVFSQFTQFALRGSSDGTITPSNIWVTAATEYETSQDVAPQSSKMSIFAAASRGSATMIRELFDTGSSSRPQFQAVEVTAQVPTYLQGTAKHLAVSGIEDMVIGLLEPASGLKNTLYAFKYLSNGNERVQSSWSKYIFSGSDCDILHIDWVDQDLFLIIKRGGQISLEKMNFEAYLKDADSDFKILLDRRITEVGLSSSYDSASNQTTFTIPYTVGTGVTMQVVTRESGATKAGLQLTVVSATGTSVVVTGDHRTTPLYFGEKYQMKYKFSQLGLRSAYYSGASSRPVPGSASFRPRYGYILFEDSAFFKVNVTPKNQTAYEYTMSGKVLSSSQNVVGAIGLESGNFRFPLMGEYRDLSIEIVNDSPLPSQLIAAEWESNYHTRNRRY